MHKLVLLSTFGRENKPEDLAYLDIYLLSLKKHVVPHFDVKVVLLYTGGGNLEKTEERISHLELNNVIMLKKINEMDLPEQSLNFWRKQPWFHKVGLNMNLLFDYAKRNDYFGAEWVIHVDTDLEFMPDFKQIFDKVDSLREFNPNILVTVAGDTFDYHFKHKNKEYILTDPTRIKWYDESGETLKHTFVYRNVKIEEKPERSLDSADFDKVVFNIQQQKIRNDFIIMPKVTANQYGSEFNWISYYYPSDFKAVDETKPEQVELQKLYEENYKDSNVKISVNNDKGSTVQLFMQGGEHTITKLQLSADDKMIRHYGSGWYLGVNFIKGSYASLKKDYSEYEYLFEPDFEGKEVEQKVPVNTIIVQPETNINDLKNMLVNLEEQMNKIKQILNSIN
jgi:hypothetical protein